jgi:hypothetical protein
MAESSIINVTGPTSFALKPRGSRTQAQANVPVDVPIDRVVIVGKEGPVPAQLMANNQAVESEGFPDEEVLGKTLDGRYHLESPLGRGGLAAVYLANDRVTGRNVALKILFPGASTEQYFHDEVAGSLEAVGLPNMTQIRGSGRDDTSLPFPARYIAMEYLEGAVTLADLLDNGKMPLPKALEITRSVCVGLEGLHAKGVVYRDLKPENIMLRYRVTGRLDFLKIIDFGLTKPGTETVSTNDTVGGTLRYMSPQQMGNQPLTPSSDMFALGLVMNDMGGGPHPFAEAQGPIPYSVFRPLPQYTFENYPAPIRGLMGRLLAIDTKDRVQNAWELRSEIDHYNETAESNYRSFNQTVAEGVAAAASVGTPNAGTMIYFTGQRITEGFEAVVNAVFPQNEGFTVYRSDGVGIKGTYEEMEGIHVYTRADRAEVMAKKGEFISNDSKAFNMVAVTAVVKEASGRPEGENGILVDANSSIVKKGKEVVAENAPAKTVAEPKMSAEEKEEHTRNDTPAAKARKPSGSPVRQKAALARTYEQALDQAQAALNSPEALKRFSEYLKSPAGKALLATEAGKKLLADLTAIAAQPNGLQALKLEGGGLLVGLVTLIGAEKLVDLLGIEDKQARFVLVMTLSHLANLKTQELLVARTLGIETARAQKLAQMIKNPTLSAKALLQFKNIFRGLGQMAFVAIIANGVLNLANVKDPALREKITLASSFIVPAAARFAYGRAAAALGESALARTGFGIASKAVGRFALVIGIMNLVSDTLVRIVSSDYRLDVNRRVYDADQTREAGRGLSGKARVFAAEFTHPILGASQEALSAHNQVALTDAIIFEDIRKSETERAELRQELGEFIGNGGDLQVLTRAASFGTIKTVSERDVYIFMLQYGGNHPGIKFGSQEHLDAVIANFGKRTDNGQPILTREDCVKIFEKGIIISWQARFAALRVIQPGIFREFGGSTLNDDIRDCFNKNGTLKPEKAAEFRGNFIGSQSKNPLRNSGSPLAETPKS